MGGANLEGKRLTFSLAREQYGIGLLKGIEAADGELALEALGRAV